MQTTVKSHLQNSNISDLAKELLSKFELNEENERTTNNALLVLQAQANLSQETFSQEYVEKLVDAMKRFNGLVAELKSLTK